MRFAKQAALGAAAFALMSLALSGCGRSVAKVNGEKISRQEYNNRMEKMAITMNGQRQQVGAIVLQQLMQEKLKLQMAKKEGVEPTKEEIKKRIDTLKRQRMYDRLKGEGYTDQDIEADARFQQANFNLLTKGAKTTDAEMRAFYDKNKKAFTTPAGGDIGLIICLTKQKMDLVRKLIKVDKQQFTAVAARQADIPDLKRMQGRIGFVPSSPELVPAERRLPPEIYKAAFKLNSGQESEPQQSRGAWFMVKMFNKRNAEVKAYPAVRDQIHEMILMQKAQEMYGPGGRKQVQAPGVRYRSFIKGSKAKINILRYKDIFKQIQDQITEEETAGRTAGTATARPATPAP